MAYPLIYPALEWLLGIGATGAGVAASNNEEVPVPSWSLRDNPVGRGLHWLFDPKWGGFATAMTYSPTTIERMPDGSYFGYQSWNNPDGTFGSEIRPNTLGTVTVMSRPRYSVISSRLYDEAPSDSISATPANPATPTDSVGSTPTPAPGPEPERNDSTSQRRPSFRERLGDRIAGRKNGQTTSRSSNPPSNNQNNQNGPFLKRLLWETEKNNFGPNWWRWRNVGRVGLVGVGTSYSARKNFWPGVYEYWAGPDSVPATTPQATPTQSATPSDTVPGGTPPSSTDFQTFDADIEALRKVYEGN